MNLQNPLQILQMMGENTEGKQFERREVTWFDTAFWNPGASLQDYDFFSGNENKNTQYCNARFPLISHGMLVTHMLVTTNLNFTVSDAKSQAQYFQYFLEQSELQIKNEFVDNAAFPLRDLVERSYVHGAPSSATAYLTGRDNMLNYYPLAVPFIVAAGKQLKVKFKTALGLTTQAYSAALTPYLPYNPASSGELSTSNQGHSMTVWLKGYIYSTKS